MQRIDKFSVVSALKNHIGKSRGVTGEKLVSEILDVDVRLVKEVDKRRFRKVVEELRMEGLPICGYPGSGYYMAADDKELIDTCLFLYDRSMTTLKQVARMRGVSELDLKGQLRLPT